MRRVPLCLLAALVLVPATAAHATNVIGNLNVDTHWTTAGSPYVLTGDVTVAPQATLTIDPGVTVQAAATDALGGGTSTTLVELVIDGRIVADGTASSPIVFKGSATAPNSWYGIALGPGAGVSSITGADVSGATIGLWVRSATSPTLSNLVVHACDQGIVWQSAAALTLTGGHVFGTTLDAISVSDDGASGATATITGVTIESAGSAGVHVHTRVNASVEACQLIGSSTGILAEAGSALVAMNDVVATNTAVGLSLAQNGTNAFTIVNNTVDRTTSDVINPAGVGDGILVSQVAQASSFIVRNNLVTNCAGTGVNVTASTAPSLDHNDVWGNGTNYAGATAGAGSISVNPLYVTPIGSGWISKSDPVSISSIPNSYTKTWTFQEPGALGMRLVISNLSLETNYDFLRLYDASGGLVATYTGTFSGTTPPGGGDTLTATVRTDSSGISSGFSISGYDYLSSSRNYRLQPTSPVIDKGNDLGAPTVDADGSMRPYDGDVNGTATTDIGAYEWHDNIPPLAMAGPDQTVLPNTVVHLDGSGSHDPDGSIVTWAWDFGDGGTASTAVADHAYTALGTYTATLTVTDDLGASSTDTAVVTVADNLPPVANAGIDQFAAVGATVTLDGGASTDPDGTIVGYAWDFGDGSPAGSGPTVTHAWALAGVYTVTLTVTDNRGATGTDTAAMVIGGGGGGNKPPVANAGGPYTGTPGQALTLDGSASSDPDGTVASWDWDFGDGSTGTGATVSHTFAAAGSYLVKLTVTDDQGATATDSTLATVTGGGNQAPVADAGGPYTAMPGQALTLDGSASNDPDGSIASWDWDFGDGSTGTGATVSHTFAAAGSYLVKLTVTDDQGATASDTTLATVGSTGNQPPVANAGPDQHVKAGDTVLLDGSASSDPDGHIVSYAWDLGDGTTATDVAVKHVYKTAGAYLVHLTVTDDGGATGEDYMLVDVADATPAKAPGCSCSAAQTGGGPVAFLFLGALLFFRPRRRSRSS